MIKIPYWYQRQAVDAIYSYFERHSGNPVIAMPTGTGKSVVIALFLYEVFCMWPNQRVVMATHDKRLIEQNADELREMWPLAPVGIFSAGLKMRQANMPIVFGGVKTMVNDVQALGWRDLMLIDECHLLSPKDDSDYQKLIFELLKINPKMKVIGLTATPFRMRQGYITDGGIFSEIAYDITSKENFNRLVAEGFLCPLYPKATQIEMDMSPHWRCCWRIQSQRR
jgi:DNA repair protein RadD